MEKEKLVLVSEAQKSGAIVAIIDMDHSFDHAIAKDVGVCLDTLLISQPGSRLEAIEIIEMLFKSNAVDMIIFPTASKLKTNG